MERRCHKCDRVVYTSNEHDGLDCENWPEMVIGRQETRYKGFAVFLIGGHWAYSLDHDDWTTCRSPAAAFTEIDLLRK